MNAQERDEKSLAVQRREPPDSKMISPLISKVKRSGSG